MSFSSSGWIIRKFSGQQAVLRVEYQELPEGMIRETKVVMEDANEGEREIIGNREKHRKCVESRAKE